MISSSFVIAKDIHAATDQDRIEELRKQIEILEQQVAQYRDSIAQNQQQARTLQNEITSLKNQIFRLEIEITATGKKINRTEIEITVVEGNIHDIQVRITNQEKAVGELLRYLYRRDKENIVGILMKSSSLQEYFRQEQYVLTIDDGLLDLINDLQIQEENLSKNKSALTEKKIELE